ncbi:MAG: FkbM family methyltransferase, partial [Thermoplasmata archaeon]|nr:FkbM family methyltransferase [Thermoplasmata archaeon]
MAPPGERLWQFGLRRLNDSDVLANVVFPLYLWGVRRFPRFHPLLLNRDRVPVEGGSVVRARSSTKTPFEMELDTRVGGDCHMLSLFRRGELYEPDVTQFIERTLVHGGTFMDVGANSGYFTLLASARVGPTGVVHAFEPNPEAVARLERNLKLNGCKNVVVHPVALGAHAGRVTLRRSLITDGMNSVLELPQSAPGPECPQEVLPPPGPGGPGTWVKIDVE